MHRYSRRRTWKRRKFLRRPVICLVLFAVVLFFYAEKRLPIIQAEIQDAALRGFADETIAETVPAYLDALYVQKENKTVIPDTYALRSVKADLTRALHEELSGKTCIWVPFGNLTGMMLLNGYGLKVPVVFSTESTVSVSFEPTLESAGINRTRYAIEMVVTVQLYSLSAAVPGSVVIQSAFPVYEEVLDGEVPQVVYGLQ